METLRETAERKGFSASEITRVSNKKEKMGHFEMEIDTGGFGMSDTEKQTNTLSGFEGGGF